MLEIDFNDDLFHYLFLFQLLQERQYSSSTDATESASVTPSATTGGGSQQEIFGAGSSKTIQHFFGSTDFYEGGLLHVLPEQVCSNISDE